jgi:hypothetical protein
MAHLYGISKPNQPVAHESAAVAASWLSDVIHCIVHCWLTQHFMLVEYLAFRDVQF